jgi:hypothetical protein
MVRRKCYSISPDSKAGLCPAIPLLTKINVVLESSGDDVGRGVEFVSSARQNADVLLSVNLNHCSAFPFSMT